MAEQPKVDVSVGLGAKVNFEVKTEIPKEVTGRLVDTLTDIIRPFSESRGLRADQIRLQREDIAISIARKALERKRLENIEMLQVPNKLLIPILEKGSLEEEDSPFIDWWANLLVTAGEANSKVRPYFTELISYLGPSEAKVLDGLWDAYRTRESFVFYPNEFPKFIFDEIRDDIQKIVSRETAETDLGWRLTTCFSLQTLAQKFVGSGVGFGAGFKFGWTEEAQRFQFESEVFHQDRVSVDVCRALNLLTYDSHVDDFGVIGMQQNYEIGILRFSVLGVEFMRACRGGPALGK